jgi:toxin ParE1/3/4
MRNSTVLRRPSLSLDEHPARGAPIPENGNLRHLLYGRRRYRYRIICALDECDRIVTVLHIRHGARDAFMPDEPDNDA